MLRTVLPWRRREDERTRAFLSAIRLSAYPTPTDAYAAADAADAAADAGTRPLPLSLVTLLVPVSAEDLRESARATFGSAVLCSVVLLAALANTIGGVW